MNNSNVSVFGNEILLEIVKESKLFSEFKIEFFNDLGFCIKQTKKNKGILIYLNAILNKNDYVGLFNRSKHMNNLKIYYTHNPKLSANFTLTYRSKYAVNDSNGNNILDKYDKFIEGYTLCDFNIIHKITENESIQLGINNIFNFTNPEYISHIPGRLYFCNLKVNFNK